MTQKPSDPTAAATPADAVIITDLRAEVATLLQRVATLEAQLLHHRHPHPPPKRPHVPPKAAPPAVAPDGLAVSFFAPSAEPDVTTPAGPPAPAPAISSADVQTALQALFPSAPVDSKVTASVLAALPQGPAYPAAPPVPGVGGGLTYYVAHAEHFRMRGTHSSFVGELPMVRFPLPLTGDFGNNLPPIVPTAIGYLIPNDRTIASVAMIPQLTGGMTAARVDLITAPRSPSAAGARFGAVATYLCYANATDTQPSFFIIEAGTATGVPMVTFLSPDMSPIINKNTQYKPTPFSRTDNYYSAWLEMNPAQPDEPQQMIVTTTDTSGGPTDPDVGDTPYVQVRITYEKQTAPPAYSPLGLILEAAARVGVIGSAIGVDPGVTEDIAKLLLSWTLSWEEKPGS
jgi:hypothetical protein